MKFVESYPPSNLETSPTYPPPSNLETSPTTPPRILRLPPPLKFYERDENLESYPPLEFRNLTDYPPRILLSTLEIERRKPRILPASNLETSQTTPPRILLSTLEIERRKSRILPPSNLETAPTTPPRIKLYKVSKISGPTVALLRKIPGYGPEYLYSV